jgi:hypothetical protein
LVYGICTYLCLFSNKFDLSFILIGVSFLFASFSSLAYRLVQDGTLVKSDNGPLWYLLTKFPSKKNFVFL